ncbi:hypothetical protein [Rhodococcus sp. IEGM 1408]|uniref:hypothetical protein n=1 Tax=Rhodococcus sp. IEGM 1408 TaxID=3082220 RepID=UPI002953351B|nr:hypothetical protein [Rhodococcus sp. IEGM 1408]MDV8002863.1 hypothetical protein [Rhodococcus sp. IEGM 1408]
MSDSYKSLADLGVALSDVAALLSDSEVLHALTSHLTAREVMIIARLFQAAGNDNAYRWVMEGIIHGDEEVRAVATPVAIGPGSVKIEYFNQFSDCGIEDRPSTSASLRLAGYAAPCGSSDSSWTVRWRNGPRSISPASSSSTVPGAPRSTLK